LNTCLKFKDGKEQQVSQSKISWLPDNEKVEDFIKVVEKFGKNLQFGMHKWKRV
jgi:hypothetical protein